MGLCEEFDDRLKAAMKAKDKPVLEVIRMIRSTAKKAALTKNVELDDALYLETIARYVKQMSRAQAEYEAAGEAGAEMAAKLAFEVSYLEPLLPKKLGADEVRSIVKAILAEQGITDARQAGRVVGMVMKDHKGLVEPLTVKQIAEEELS